MDLPSKLLKKNEEITKKMTKVYIMGTSYFKYVYKWLGVASKIH